MIQYTSVIPFWKWDGKYSSLVNTEVIMDEQGNNERENKEDLYIGGGVLGLSPKHGVGELKPGICLIGSRTTRSN